MVVTALCVSTNYAMIGVPNVKFMDLLVFTSGFCFGCLVGGLVGVLTWSVYGTLNPYGFSLPILVATSVGEALYGVVGGLARRFGLRVPDPSRFGRKEYWICSVKIAFLGFLLTFAYDLLTNLVTAFSYDPWRPPIIAILISGIPFAIAHEGSNLAFFFWGGSALITVIRKLPFRRGEMYG